MLSVDVRSNVTLACPYTQSPGSTLLWGHNIAGRPNWEIVPDSRHTFLSKGALVIRDVQMSDHGNYSCHHNNTSNTPLTSIQLVVQGMHRRSSCSFIPFSSASWSVAYGWWKVMIFRNFLPLPGGDSLVLPSKRRVCSSPTRGTSA